MTPTAEAAQPEGPRLVTCPSCGGTGGGPFGPVGSAWDDEDYACPRCKGRGVIPIGELAAERGSRPGVIKTDLPAREAPSKKKQA